MESARGARQEAGRAMPFGWLLNPVTYCALAVMGLGFTLHLICTLKIRRPGAGRPVETPASVPPQIARLEQRLEELAAAQRVSEQADAVSAAPPPVGAGFNLNRRSYALRLYRRGETPERISSALGLAAGEVRLLIKVHRIMMEPARPGALKPAAGSADMSQ